MALVWPCPTFASLLTKGMGSKETIALIELTNEAAVLSAKLALQNYRLLLASKDQYRIGALLNEIIYLCPNADIEAIDCLKNACWEADIIVLFGTGDLTKELVDKIAPVSMQKIVVVISFADTRSISSSEAKDVQSLLPHSKVVHVFNTGDPAQIFIAGDDKASIQSISHMAAQVGYNPTVVGTLSSTE